MGGLSGHMLHPHENLDLTKQQLEDLVFGVLNGEYQMDEKVDGNNIHVLISKDLELKIARSGSDIKQGGISLDQLEDRFIKSSCNFKNLIKRRITPDQVLSLLNKKSVAINSVLEAHNMKIYHPQVSFVFEMLESEDHTNLLYYGENPGLFLLGMDVWSEDFTSKLSYSLTDPDIKIYDIEEVVLENLSKELDTIWNINGNGSEETIYDLYIENFLNIVRNKLGIEELPVDLYRQLFDRKMGYSKVNLRDLKKEYPDFIFEIDEILGSISVREINQPLREFIRKVGNILLSNVASGYINEDLQGWNTGDSPVPGYLLHPLEGVIVRFEDNLYKFTGDFAEINRLYFKQ